MAIRRASVGDLDTGVGTEVGRSGRCLKIALCGAAWGAACTTTHPTGGITTLEKVCELRSIEAACLLAEALAHEFTAVNRDPLRPRARAYDLGHGCFRIRYLRRPGEPHLPSANGHFVRSHRTGVLADETGPLPTTPVPGVRFVPERATAPDARAREGISVEVQPAGPGHSRVRITCSRTSAWSGHRRRELLRLLHLAAGLKRGLQLARSGEFDRALRQIRDSTTYHRAGLSNLHDPLLANAFLLQARLHQLLGQTRQAQRAATRARLLVADSASVLLLESRLRRRLARPDGALASLAGAASLLAPGDAHSRVVAFAHRQSSESAAAERTLELALERGQLALTNRDWESARAWSNRALDLAPGHAEALRHLADALEGMSRHEESRGHRLMSLHTAKATPDLIRKVAGDEAACGDPSLALRWLLRHSRELPEVLSNPKTVSLARALGWKRALRMFRTEKMEYIGLPVALAWLREARDPRDIFVAELLARDALTPSGPKPGSVPVRAPDNTFGRSGVRVGTAGPPR